MTRRTCGLLVALLLAPAASFADEGMWLFTNAPKKQLKDKYNVDITDKWLDHVQKSSIRFPHGSGSFVSADGLVMTNHHVGAEAVQKIGENDGKDYIKDGFHARSQKDEKKVPGMELNVLMSIEDVTKTVNAAVKAEMKPAEVDRRGGRRRRLCRRLALERPAVLRDDEVLVVFRLLRHGLRDVRNGSLAFGFVGLARVGRVRHGFNLPPARWRGLERGGTSGSIAPASQVRLCRTYASRTGYKPVPRRG